MRIQFLSNLTKMPAGGVMGIMVLLFYVMKGEIVNLRGN